MILSGRSSSSFYYKFPTNGSGKSILLSAIPTDMSVSSRAPLSILLQHIFPIIPTEVILNSDPGSIAVAVGGYNSCRISLSQKLWCRGDNSAGQLGLGHTSAIAVEQQVVFPGSPNVLKVSINFITTCAITQIGTNPTKLYCWGYNTYGQIGNGTRTSSSTPVDVLDDALEIGVGTYHSCALMSNGEVKCWGCNGQYQLGNGNSTSPVTPVTARAAPTILAGVAKISVGNYNSCAITSAGELKCWGDNTTNMFGLGPGALNNSPPTLITLNNVSEVSVGAKNMCAVLTDNSLKCWGLNDEGQNGSGDKSPTTYPPASYILSSVAKVAAGENHTCALMINGDVKCWGKNDYGQLGNDLGANILAPPSSPILTNIATLNSNKYSTCAIKPDSSQLCWGNDASNQLQTNKGYYLFFNFPEKIISNKWYYETITVYDLYNGIEDTSTRTLSISPTPSFLTTTLKCDGVTTTFSNFKSGCILAYKFATPEKVGDTNYTLTFSSISSLGKAAASIIKKIQVDTTENTTLTKFQMNTVESAVVNTCIPVYVTPLNSNGAAVITDGATQSIATMSSNTASIFYYDTTCLAADSRVILYEKDYKGIVFFKPTTSGTHTITATSGSTISSVTITVP